MKIKTTEEFLALTPPATGQKRKINNFAVLTPALAENIQKTDMSPAKVALAIIEQIRVSAPSTTAPTEADSSFFFIFKCDRRSAEIYGFAL